MKKIPAKPISYDSTKKRDKKNCVEYIVIHYTGNKGDTAKNNCLYFQNSNKSQVGAHFFIDRAGNCYKSINMNRTAWAVGKDYRSGRPGEARFYKKCTNYNSVSIELCDIVDKYPSKAQIEATKKCIKYIRKYCPNATKVIRHFDVNGKECPASMIDNKKWNRFVIDIGEHVC